MNCLLHSFQTVTQLDLVSRLGHDGSKVLYPQYPEPYCWQAFHTQEMLKACWPEFAFMEIQARPAQLTFDQVRKIDHTDWFMKMISELTGVIIGVSVGGIPHAEPVLDGQFNDCFDVINSFYLSLTVRPQDDSGIGNREPVKES
jgi:hypothetical protein